jgi:opacity protein-like surface antigen
MAGPVRFVLCAVLSLALAGTALAQAPAEPQPIGLSIGLRTGYGLPGGKIGGTESMDDSSLSDGVTGMVPLWLDLGYRITPHLAVGASVQYGFGIANTDMDRCPDCTIDIIGIGASVYAHAAPGARFDPWAGLGVGYEIFTVSTRFFEDRVKLRLEGFQFAVLQFGGDFTTSTPITLGPFVAVALGTYDSMTAITTFGGRTASESRDLQNTSWHEWFTLGVQGRFNL